MNSQDFEAGKRAILRELVGVAGLCVRVDRCEAGGVAMLRVTMSREGSIPVVRRIATKVDRPILTMLQCDAARLVRSGKMESRCVPDMLYTSGRAEALVKNTVACIESRLPPEVAGVCPFILATWKSGPREFHVAFSSFGPHCHLAATDGQKTVLNPFSIQAVMSSSGFEVIPPAAIRPWVDWVYGVCDESAVGAGGELALRESGWFSRSEIADLLK